MSGCLAKKFQKLFSSRLDGLGNRLETGFFDACDLPQGLSVCVQPKPSLLSSGQVREGFPDTGFLFFRIVLHGIFVARAVLFAFIVDSVVGVAMTATPLVRACSALRLSMITAPISSEISTSAVVPSRNAYLIFSLCPFRLRRYLAVRAQKEPEVTMDTPADSAWEKT